MGIRITRSPVYYFRRTPLLAFPLVYLVTVIVDRREVRGFGSKLKLGWLLFGVTSFLISTAGLLDLFPEIFSFVYLGAYGVAGILALLSLGYLVKTKIEKKEENMYETL